MGLSQLCGGPSAFPIIGQPVYLVAVTAVSCSEELVAKCTG